MTTTENTNEPAPACIIDETALSASERENHLSVAHKVMSAIQEVRELPDGYALRLPLEASMIQVAAEFIALEQKCCGFIGFNLEIEPNNGPMWLSLTGGAGAKEFLQAELGMN